MLQEPSSPAADEREFVDDDGTHFVWDPSLRKFRPTELADAAAAPEYTADMMRFSGEQEAVVTLEEAQAEEEASQALADKLADAQAQGSKVRLCPPRPEVLAAQLF